MGIGTHQDSSRDSIHPYTLRLVVLLVETLWTRSRTEPPNSHPRRRGTPTPEFITDFRRTSFCNRIIRLRWIVGSIKLGHVPIRLFLCLKESCNVPDLLKIYNTYDWVFFFVILFRKSKPIVRWSFIISILKMRCERYNRNLIRRTSGSVTTKVES